MQKSSFITFAIVFIAIIVLFVLQLKPKSGDNDVQNSTPAVMVKSNDSCVAKSLKIAYINLDSIMLEYSYYKELNDQLVSKQLKAENQYNSKMKALEKDYNETQDKIQKGLMTRAEIADAETALNARQQEIAELQQKLSNDLMVEEQRLLKMLADTVKLVVSDFNKNAGYDLIVNNLQNSIVLDACPSMNITNEILALLEQRHNMNKK